MKCKHIYLFLLEKTRHNLYDRVLSTPGAKPEFHSHFMSVIEKQVTVDHHHLSGSYFCNSLSPLSTTPTNNCTKKEQSDSQPVQQESLGRVAYYPHLHGRRVQYFFVCYYKING